QPDQGERVVQWMPPGVPACGAGSCATRSPYLSDRPAGTEVGMEAAQVLVEVVELPRPHDRGSGADPAVERLHRYRPQQVGAVERPPADQHVEVDVGEREAVAEAPVATLELARDVRLVP